MTSSRTLRPLERRVTKLVESGVGQTEIARRFRRSPEMIGRIITMAALPVSTAADAATSGQLLRPLERRVLRMREAGVGYDEIATRFRRSVAGVRQVERLARYRTERS
jgi:DNA-binding CsgD family transcriptional regulator